MTMTSKEQWRMLSDIIEFLGCYSLIQEACNTDVQENDDNNTQFFNVIQDALSAKFKRQPDWAQHILDEIHEMDIVSYYVSEQAQCRWNTDYMGEDHLMWDGAANDPN